MTPVITPRKAPARSSWEEFRSAKTLREELGEYTTGTVGEYVGIDDPVSTRPERVFWKLMTAPISTTGADLRIHLTEPERRTLSKATNGAGAYLVPADLESEIVQVLRSRSVMTRLARVLNTNQGANTGLPTTTAHGTATWTAENASVTASDETFGQVSIGAYKGTAEVLASEELVADADIELDTYLVDELGARLAALADTAYVAGDGTGKPLGIATSGNGVSVVTAATGSATAFKLADLLAVYKAVPAAYRPRSAWLIHPDDFASLAGYTDSSGGIVFASLHAETPTLFGRPVELSADLATPAANGRSLVFGDFQTAYTIRIVRGIAISRQDEIYSANGQIGYRGFLRTDGRVVQADAVRVLAHSAT